MRATVGAMQLLTQCVAAPRRLLGCFAASLLHPRSSPSLAAAAAAQDYATSSGNPPIFFAISFQSTGEPGGSTLSYSYTLRGNVTFSDDSSSAIDTSQATVNNLQVEYDSDSFQLAYLRGQLFFQHFVEDWIVARELAPGTEIKRSAYYQPAPTPPYVDDTFADVISTFLGQSWLLNALCRQPSAASARKLRDWESLSWALTSSLCCCFAAVCRRFLLHFDLHVARNSTSEGHRRREAVENQGGDAHDGSA